jgi:copper chaperone CopZ
VKISILAGLVPLLLSLAGTAQADRTQVFSIQGADCGKCGDEIKDELKKVKGVKKAEFDMRKVELTVRLADGVGDDVVVAAVETRLGPRSSALFRRWAV